VTNGLIFSVVGLDLSGSMNVNRVGLAIVEEALTCILSGLLLTCRRHVCL
jgi:hypothetical protein